MSYFSQGKNDAKGSKAATPEPRFDTPTPAGRTASPDVLSTFGHGMLITGNIVCAGAVQIFGRVTGEIHASHLVICEGAKVEGKVTVQEAIIQGTFNGTIHGNSVKLQGTAVVDGEIFNKALTIEENALFEGVSRRLERPIEAPSLDRVQAETPVPAAPPAVAPAYSAERAPLQVVPAYDPIG